MHIPEDFIVTETKSEDIFESISLSHHLLKKQRINPGKMIVVHLPFLEKIIEMVLLSEWPGIAPQLSIRGKMG